MRIRLLIASLVVLRIASGQTSYVSACSTKVSFNFASGVTLPQQSMIHDSTIAGVEYICRKTVYGVAEFQVFVSPNNDDLIQDLVNVFGYPADSAGPPPICAVSPLGGILINVSNSSCWNWTSADIKTRVAKTMAHEYFHQVQRRLARVTSPYESTGPDGVALKGPAWLLEGAAELVGLMAIDDAGLRSFPETITQWEIPALIEDSFELTAQEQIWNPPSQGDPYTYVAAAVDLLTAGAPAKIAWLAGFWDAIGKGAPWQQSLQSSFGVSAANFYPQFNAYVAPFHTKSLSLVFIGAGAPIANSAANGVGYSSRTLFLFLALQWWTIREINLATCSGYLREAPVGAHQVVTSSTSTC
jgi:hypothetical protein